jgi:hypothetical protein
VKVLGAIWATWKRIVSLRAGIFKHPSRRWKPRTLAVAAASLIILGLAKSY